MNDEVAYPRFASRGRTFVYVLPCRDEDILKVGFSRDPLQRMRSLHARFFEFFDLDRALLIECEHLRDARRIERLFITTFAEHRAPAPLVVPLAAAGHTEWYRGIHPRVTALARSGVPPRRSRCTHRCAPGCASISSRGATACTTDRRGCWR